MFHNLATQIQNAGADRNNVFLIHPYQLSRWLDEAWAAPALLPPIVGVPGGPPMLGSNQIVPAYDLPPDGSPAASGFSGVSTVNPAAFTGGVGPVGGGLGMIWHHLVYAYLIENTGAVEIFAEVVRRLVQGETLEAPSVQALQWARATEELFFRDAPTFSIMSSSSQLRPDARSNRRNAYWRMLGMDLSHSIPPRWSGPLPDQSWKADTGNGVNTSFREKWSELLRQVWLGYENRRNFIGANATDATFVQLLCESLSDMLNMRRRNGMLAREEFTAVALASWFQLTLDSDTPIVVSLNAQATSPADRLTKVAQRVGMSPAPRSRELFDLAVPMSTILRTIETGFFNNPATAELLYAGPAVNPIRDDMNNIIDLWQSATGERVKDRTLIGVQSSAQPLRVPPPQAIPVGAGANGSR
jgi:hypothetical protein